MKAKRAKARTTGGLKRRKSHSKNIDVHKIRTYHDIQKVLEIVINNVCSWENSERRARTLGYLCKIAANIQYYAEDEV
jgi:hypothetical protein